MLPASCVLMFHHIVDDPEIKNSGCLLSYNHFMDIILQYRDYYVPLAVLLRGRRRKAAVTFDDGLADVYNVAYPLLKAHSIPFTVFVITDFLDKPGYLTTEQLKELSADPLVTIGSHGLSHELFPRMTSSQKRKELIDSREVLQRITGQRIEVFAYSHGQFDKETLNLVKCYDYAVSTRGYPLNCLTAKRYQIPRLNVDNPSYERIKKLLDEKICKSRKWGTGNGSI